VYACGVNTTLTQVGLLDARPHLGDHVNAVWRERTPVVITRYEQPRAVLIHPDDYDDLMALRAARDSSLAAAA
jgi:prevent-host-death family protein